MSAAVRVSELTEKQLNELSKKRKADHAIVKSKQAIAAEAIEILYKKEIKK